MAAVPCLADGRRPLLSSAAGSNALAPLQPGDDKCSSVPHDYAVREETR